MTNHSHEHFEILLVKAVDGLLEPDERRELDRHVQSCQRCADELADFRRIKETTDAMTSRILQDASIEPPRASGLGRWVLRMSYLLLLAGALLLLGFAVRSFAFAPELPAVVKLGAALVGVGLVGLLGHALRYRLRAVSRDPYEEIDR